jgi:hypothetical protein
MKSSLPHARLHTLAKYEIEISKMPLNSRLLQMAEKATDPKLGRSVSKTMSEKRTSSNISMERINRLAQPKRIQEKVSMDCRTTTTTKSPSRLVQKSQDSRRQGISHVRQKRSPPMSLTAAAIALDKDNESKR